MFIDKNDIFWAIMNAGGHGLELNIIHNRWCVLSTRDPLTVFRWLGPNNIAHGQNKLQALKAFRSNSLERAKLFETITLLPKFSSFFDRYESVGTRASFALFKEDFELYEKLLLSNPTTNFIVQLIRYLCKLSQEKLSNFVLSRLNAEHVNLVQRQIISGHKHSAVSTMLANWAFLKHPLICTFTALEISDKQPFTMLVDMNQFLEPTFFGRLYLSFYVSRFARAQPRAGMVKKYFNLPQF